GGTRSIGVASVEDDRISVESDPVFEGSEDHDGVSHPVVVATDDGYRMYYASWSDGQATIRLATSQSGFSWDPQGEALDLGEDWDSLSVEPGSIEELSDGTWRLWYTGSDGDTTRIGTATSEDGLEWTREVHDRDWAFAPGAPGEWDDSGVRDPWFVEDDDGQHLWFAGYDSEAWRIGYAWRADDDDSWTRSQVEATEETRPVISVSASPFHPDAVLRPVAMHDGDTWQVWYAGVDDTTPRIGRATGTEPDRLHIRLKRPTLGDTLVFRTEGAEEDANAIVLDTTIEAVHSSGYGLASLALDEERGFLYASSKLLPYVFVIDIRDDSTDDFDDLNYLDIEAIMVGESAAGSVGFREILPVPGRDMLYALNDAPEAIWILDLAEVEDDAYSDVIEDVVLGWLPTSRGRETDEGNTSQMSLGPTNLTLHPDGRRL
ncbi:MAG: hypothetical protein QGG40_20925, partial [Myxococcota bacterium]|nr:hypothetical protein [Myxococcota bacterium]